MVWAFWRLLLVVKSLLWSVQIVCAPNNCIAWLVNLCLLHEFMFLIGILLASFGVSNRNILSSNLLPSNVTNGLSTNQKNKKRICFLLRYRCSWCFLLKLEWIIPVKYLFSLPFSFSLFPSKINVFHSRAPIPNFTLIGWVRKEWSKSFYDDARCRIYRLLASTKSS